MASYSIKLKRSMEKDLRRVPPVSVSRVVSAPDNVGLWEVG